MSDRMPIPAPNAPRRSDVAERFRRHQSRQRGTVLLMVVGVLALLAIIAVVYATLGRADRSASATLVQQQRSDLQVSAVADYFVSVVGGSTFARYTEPNFNTPNATTQPSMVQGSHVFTRGYTYPWTDEYFLSIPTDSTILSNSGVMLPTHARDLAQYTRFSPTGDNADGWKNASGNLALLDPREFGDPFLAATRPTFGALDPVLNNDAMKANQIKFLPARQRDWLHISNFAPSGNFINLANFRPENGGFNAKHGFAFQGQLSYGLTLFNPATGVSYPANGAQPLPKRPTRVDDPPNNNTMRMASPLVPAHWTTDQVWAFRPAFDATYGPNKYEYLLNQWADTDGDGFVDARWFTLDRIENFDPATRDAIVRSVVPSGSRLRYVFAARAVDNSSMLNVNVHTDFLNGPLTLTGVGASASIVQPPTTRPDDYAPPGLTPADVDLARLLTMRDAFNDTRNNWNVPATGIAGFPTGVTANDIERDYTFTIGGTPGARTAADNIGRSAFAALENMRRTGTSRATGIYDPFERHELAGATPTPEYTDGVFRRDRFELESLSAALNNESTLTRRDTTGATQKLGRLAGVFGLDDELELRTFWGVNNPDTRSSLEVALGGRSTNNLYRNYSPLRDTRSQGIEALGRDVAANQLFPASSDPGTDQKRTLMSVYADVRQFLTTTSGARPIKDSGVAPAYDVQFPQTAPLPAITGTTSDFQNRKMRAEAKSTGNPLTEVVQSRPDITALLNQVQRFAEENIQTPKTTKEIRDFVEFAATNNGREGGNTDAKKAVVYQIFELYANALMPYTHRTFYPGAWQFIEPTTDPKIKHYVNGLAYGGSPELALRMAAHMAVNLVDAFDRDRPVSTGGSSQYDRHTPTAVTVIMAENPNAPGTPRATGGNSLSNRTSADEDIERSYPYPQLKLHPTERLPATRNQNGQGVLGARADSNNSSGRLTVFGVEPQPFLVEVSAFAMYTDAPKRAGGDTEESPPSDSGPGNTNRSLRDDPTSTPSQVTIRIDPDLTKPDFLGEVLAFKLYNPFDVVVTLFDDNAPAGQDKILYYLEYANRYYAFCPTVKDSASGTGIRFRRPGTSTGRIDLWPGETLTFYAINPGRLDELWNRFKNVLEDAPDPVKLMNIGDLDTTLKPWFVQQFGDGVRPSGALPNPQIDVFDRQLTPIYPDSLQPIVSANTPNFRTYGAQDEVDLFGEQYLPGVNGPGSPSSGGLPKDLETAQPAERKVAHLWRVMRTEISADPRGTSTEGDLNTGGTAQFNDPTNDLLADRLRDPTVGGEGKLFTTVRNSYPPGFPGDGKNQKIGGTEAGSETSSILTSVKDNTGFTSVIWAAIRRPADSARTSGGTLETGNLLTRGVLPPWCMEVRSDHGSNVGSVDATFSLNDITGDSGVTDAGDRSDYTVNGQDERFICMRDMVTATAGASKTIKKPMTQVAGYRTVPSMSRVGTGLQPKAFRELAVEYHGVGETPDGKDTINPALFSRSGDFLLPLAIGPVYDPSIDIDSTGLSLSWTESDTKMTKRELQWLTLSEALALSAGYFTPARQDDILRDFGLEENIGSGSYRSNYPSRAKTDRGHLRLDAFTPYLDVDGPTGTPAEPIGGGVPFALSVIDQFRAAPGVSTTSEVVDGVSWPRGQNYIAAAGGGSFNPRVEPAVSLVPGLMNINTLSAIPMRQLPMVAPDTSDDSWLRKSISSRMSIFTEALKPAPTGPAAPTIVNWDVASTIEAYRDRRDVFDFRFDDSTGTSQLASAADSPLRFRQFTRDQHSRIDFNSTPVAGSTLGHGIQRQARGIKSLGELFSINVRDNPQTNGTVDPFWTGSVFALSPERDPTVTSSVYADSRIAGWPEVSGSMVLDRNDKGQVTVPLTRRGVQVDQSYADKLAIANSLTNTASVRSDIFTVYFLVHGYSPEDIEAVDGKPDEPLIPSVAKRFVMVLDRSNVVAAGDKPKVLMLREVPIR